MSKFKIGDRVRIYGHPLVMSGTVYGLPPGCIRINVDPDKELDHPGYVSDFHPKQCRKLRPKKHLGPKEVWVNVRPDGSSDASYPDPKTAERYANGGIQVRYVPGLWKRDGDDIIRIDPNKTGHNSYISTVISSPPSSFHDLSFIALCSPENILRLLTQYEEMEARVERESEVRRAYEKALETCAGGDLASGDGIYKAEIAREALAAGRKLLGEGV